ncbi:MAG: hypothetical protein LKI76_00010 [Megasphaera sp.]|nr:hypothetical protein [Megasphaera sp.]
MNLFDEDLIKQGEGSFLDIKEGIYDTFMMVPYWSWFEKKTEVLQLLSNMSDNDQVKFVWPLIRDKISDYSCYISGKKIEITPYNPNVSVFGSFVYAKHRVLMSATTQDDSFFVKGLNFDPAAVKHPLTNQIQKWSGEKMIIMPSMIREDCNHELVIKYFSNLDIHKLGIVALVPSTERAMIYKQYDAIVTDKHNIRQEIDKLRKGNFRRLVVINNRYDGIDLPDESCRILIIDSKPYFDSLSDRYEEKCRPDSEEINKKVAQKIEQGIGRGVRGAKDYCAILIIGPDLVRFMRSSNTNKYFSEQTRKQVDIGNEIISMAQEESNDDNNPMKEVNSLIKQMLNRDEGWKE